MTVGERIKKIRQEKGMTQKELGKKCGLADSAVRRYELGGANPKIETIERIANALEVSIVDIIDNITFKQLQKTEMYKKACVNANAYIGVINILAVIYGRIEKKEVEVKVNENIVDEYSVENYYLVGTDENKFILYMNDIDNLLEYLKKSLPFVVDGLKDMSPEHEVIEEIKRKLKQDYKENSN